MCDYPDVYNEQRPIARYEYRCCECWRLIGPGTQYVRVDGKWVGEWDTYIFHLACFEFHILIKEYYPHDCIAFTELEEAITETREQHLKRHWVSTISKFPYGPRPARTHCRGVAV